MSNTIRTPRQGVTAGSRRIAEAVDNEEWQRFRLSMKGKATSEKLDMLHRYYQTAIDYPEDDIDDVVIRVDNYIKALCRGGQLKPGESLWTAVAADWKLEIRK